MCKVRGGVKAGSTASADFCQESLLLGLLLFICAPSIPPSFGCPWVCLALLRFLITTHLLCWHHQHTWTTSTPIYCSIKAPSSSTFSATLFLNSCGNFVKVSQEIFICFCPLVVQLYKLLDQGLCTAVSSNLPFCLFSAASRPFGYLPASVLFLFSLPLPISPLLFCVTAINIIFPGQQSGFCLVSAA